MKTTSKMTFLLCIFFALLTMLIYANTLRGPFILDDATNIVDNPYIRLQSLNLKDIVRATGGPCSRRIVANLSFAFNYYIGRYSLPPFHVFNIFVHIVTGILLFLFLKMSLYLTEPRLTGKHKFYLAAAAALLWLVHPIQTQSVSYIVQRMNSMMAMFYVASILCYIKARHAKGANRLFYASAALMAGLMALGSKENAATLPFFILLYEWYFFQDMGIKWLTGRYKMLLLAGTAVLALLFVYLGGDIFSGILTGYQYRPFTLGQRLLTQLRVITYFISLLFYPQPSRLNLDYDFPLSLTLIDPWTTLLSLITLMLLLGFAIYAARKKRLISFAILWFLGNLLIESSFIPLEIIFEHRLYLPSMLLIFAVVYGADRYIRNLPAKISMLVVFALIFSIWTYQRNIVWANDISLWADCVSKAPGKARAHNNYGEALQRAKMFGEAGEQYQMAIMIDEESADAHNNLGVILSKEGKNDKAVAHIKKALQLDPKMALAWFNLANIAMKSGERQKGIEYYKNALETNTAFAKAAATSYNLGNIYNDAGDLNNAIKYYRQAIEINPGYAASYNNLGVIYARRGDMNEAVRYFRGAVQADPDDRQARRNLQQAYNSLPGR